MWNTMINEKPSVFEESNAKGVERVLSTKNSLYAFFMESTGIDYEMERKCDLRRIGDLLDSKSYGIGMPLSMFLITLKTNVLLNLYRRWLPPLNQFGHFKTTRNRKTRRVKTKMVERRARRRTVSFGNSFVSLLTKQIKRYSTGSSRKLRRFSFGERGRCFHCTGRRNWNRFSDSHFGISMERLQCCCWRTCNT